MDDKRDFLCPLIGLTGQYMHIDPCFGQVTALMVGMIGLPWQSVGADGAWCIEIWNAFPDSAIVNNARMRDKEHSGL